MARQILTRLWKILLSIGLGVAFPPRHALGRPAVRREFQGNLDEDLAAGPARADAVQGMVIVEMRVNSRRIKIWWDSSSVRSIRS
jgi:hypothetical protein